MQSSLARASPRAAVAARSVLSAANLRTPGAFASKAARRCAPLTTGATNGSKCPKCGSMSLVFARASTKDDESAFYCSVCSGWFVASEQRVADEIVTENVEQSEIQAVPTPRKIYAGLDEHVIGQHDVKMALSVAVHNHYQRLFVAKKREASSTSESSFATEPEDRLLKPLSLANLAQLSGKSEPSSSPGTSDKKVDADDVEHVELEKSNVPWPARSFTNRGDAAAATWRVRGDETRRTPAAATWLVRGDGSWRTPAAATWRVPGRRDAAAQTRKFRGRRGRGSSVSTGAHARRSCSWARRARGRR